MQTIFCRDIISMTSAMESALGRADNLSELGQYREGFDLHVPHVLQGYGMQYPYLSFFFLH